MGCIIPVLGLVLGMLYTHESLSLPIGNDNLALYLKDSFLKIFAMLSLLSGVIAWWMVLTQQSRRVAQEESNRQTMLLLEEIDSHKRTDEQLQRATRLADQANQAKSRYITAISHELRTPLNSILGYAQILDADGDIPPHRQQAVSVIRKSGDHLLSLIEGTLDIAKIEGGRLALDIRPLVFKEFLLQIVGMFELQARNRGLTFDYIESGKLPEYVRADEKRLRQILINILGNAIKFTLSGGVVFKVEFLREMAIFEISDTGPGIPEAELENIYEPFVRGSNAQASGSGVGLTIARMLTDLMGGEMQVRSETGVGTTFRIRLFLPKVHEGMSHRVIQRLRPSGYEGPRRRILVVDNEKADRELLSQLLTPLGFIVEQAESGEASLDVIGEFQPDIVFMDLAMPGIDGWETVSRIRSQQLSNAKIAIISANAFDKGLENSCGIEAEDFIVKPIKVQDLYGWIGQAIDLTWIESPDDIPSNGVPISPPPIISPGGVHRKRLEEAINLGYLRGILEVLESIENLDPRYAEYVGVLRNLAKQFEFDAMTQVIRKYEHESH
jgi:signal transduction histidine kinase/CheY-like chemotaxis protein